MSLTKDDREIVALIGKEVAGQVAEKFATAQSEAMARMIELHQATCPAGRQLFGSKRFLLGLLVGLGLLTAGGSALGSLLMRLLTGP